AGVERVPDVGLHEPRAAALDVDARAEGAITVRLQHDSVDVVGVADGLPRPRDLVRHLVGERVECVGSIQRDRGDVIVTDLELDLLRLHPSPLVTAGYSVYRIAPARSR